MAIGAWRGVYKHGMRPLRRHLHHLCQVCHLCGLASLAAALLLATALAHAGGTAPRPGAAPALPTLPRASIGPADLAVLVAEGDALSEAAALAYQQARGIPAANIIRVAVPAGSDSISDSDFASLKAAIDARLPPHVQAQLVTWLQPSRVLGSTVPGAAGGAGSPCTMGITSALAFGFNPAFCGGCRRTQASAYYDSDTTRPWTDLRIRPAMLLGAATPDAARALIQRGLAAEGTAPTGTGWLVRTADAARSVRWPDYLALPAQWTATPDAPAGAGATPGLALRYLDASDPATAQEVVDQTDLLFYFTGAMKLARLDSNRFLPGAVADHLTSSGGALPNGYGQMPATAWLAAGATASYGTVEEPCNHVDKFPRASVLIEHYLRGATVLEAYWKSVAWPGQGLFVGDPLARPWAHVPSAVVEDGAVVVRTRALRRLTTYQVELQPAGSSTWRPIGSLSAGQPRPVVWRLPLPADAAGGKLRWLGPCPLRPVDRCVLASPPD